MPMTRYLYFRYCVLQYCWHWDGYYTIQRFLWVQDVGKSTCRPSSSI